MHRRRHAGRLQLLLHRVAIIHAHRVLSPGADVVRFDVGRGVDAGVLEQTVVVGGDLLAELDLLGQDLELGQQDGGLQGVEAAIHAHSDVVVAAVLPVAGDLADELGELVVVGEDRTAVAVAAERLAGEEAGAGDGAEVARHAALVAGAEALCSVFNHRYAVLGGDGVDGVEVGALAVQAHRDDGAGLGRDGGFEQRRVEVVGARIDVDIHRLGTEYGDGFGGGDVGEARGDDLVAVGHAHRHLGDLQGVGAVGAGDAVLGADEGGELFFQFGHFGAEDVLAVGQHALDAGVDLVLDAGLLGFEVAEFDHFCWASDLLGLRCREGVAVERVARAGVRAGVVALALDGQRDLFAVFAHPADLASGHADHEGVGLDVLVDDGAGTDEGEFANGGAADDGAVGAQGGAALDQGVAVFALALDERAGVIDVGKHHAGAAEHAFLEGDVVVHRDVVLHLALVADDDLVADEDVLAERDALADAGAGADVGEVPDARAFADLGALVDDGAGVDGVAGMIGHCRILCAASSPWSLAVVHLPP